MFYYSYNVERFLLRASSSSPSERHASVIILITARTLKEHRSKNYARKKCKTGIKKNVRRAGRDVSLTRHKLL